MALENNILTPTQFWGFLKGPLPGERKLAIAILEDAVYCFQHYLLARKVPEKKLFKEAEEWIESTSRKWIFSFENICLVFELDPSYIRKGLKDWASDQKSRAAKGLSLKEPFGTKRIAPKEGRKQDRRVKLSVVEI